MSRFTLIIYSTIFLIFVNACYEFILMLCQRLDEEILRDGFFSFSFQYSSSFFCLSVNLLFAFNGFDPIIYLPFWCLLRICSLLIAHSPTERSFNFHLQMAFHFSYFLMMIIISPKNQMNKNIECRRRQNTIQITEG